MVGGSIVYAVGTFPLYERQRPAVRKVKFGTSADPMKRLGALARTSPVRLYAWGVMPGALEAESRIHLALDAARSHGEWFEVDQSTLVAVEIMNIAAAAVMGANDHEKLLRDIQHALGDVSDHPLIAISEAQSAAMKALEI
jgi:hypothetical protein